MCDVPLGMNTCSKPMLFADDMSVLITANNLNYLQTKSISILNYMRKSFPLNGLTLNIEKTNVIQLKSNHLQNYSFQIFMMKKKLKK